MMMGVMTAKKTNSLPVKQTKILISYNNQWCYLCF